MSPSLIGGRPVAVQCPFRKRPLDSGDALSVRAGCLAYACNDTLSEAAITDIMGPRLSAAHTRFGRNISIVGATSLIGGCAVVAGCSMIVASLQTRSGTGAASSGSSP